MAHTRGQVAFALLHAFASGQVSSIERPSTNFTRRVTNFIERGLGPTGKRRGGERGVDHVYEVEDACELALALDMQDLGMPQSEIIVFVQRNRSRLRQAIRRVSSQVPATAAYLVLRPRPQIKFDGQSASELGLAKSPFLFYAPHFAYGIAERDKITAGWPSCTWIDIGQRYWAVRHYLDVAPEIRRGPK
jgi:hypothetical protein